MKIGFAVNDPRTEKPGHTTTHLALAARARGHETWHIGVADFAMDSGDRVTAAAIQPAQDAADPKAFSAALKACEPARIMVGELDVLMLRSDPADDAGPRPWACLAGVNFGRFAKEAGVTVVNDPDGLNHAINKLYLQHFPRAVRPEAIVSRHVDEILAFVSGHDGPSVIKPLTGSGGHDVFVLEPDERRNVHQMIEAVIEDGFALVQAYVPGASAGDLRLLMVNGEILRVDGRAALIRRHGSAGDLRHNITAGGKAEAAELTPEIERLAEQIGPRLREDGIFLAGVDIIGDKILEINVFSPGAMVSASRIYGVSFETEIIRALEARRIADIA